MLQTEWLVIIVVGYLLGSIPTGLVVGKLLRGIDIREYGSGQVGATNTLRTLGRGPSAAVFLFDMAKGAGALLLARSLGGPAMVQALAATAAIAGHCWSVYIGFRGGRGVATGVGALFAYNPLVGALALAAALITMARTRYASLGSLVGTAVGFIIVTGMIVTRSVSPDWFIYAVGATGIIFLRHRENIARLRAGTERRLGKQEDKQLA